MPEFANIFDFADAHHNLMLSCYEEITDLDKIKAKLQSYGEIGEILEASSSRQLRRWTCRLDDENGLWEECVFTDDVLQDRTVNTAVSYTHLLPNSIVTKLKSKSPIRPQFKAPTITSINAIIFNVFIMLYLLMISMTHLLKNIIP